MLIRKIIKKDSKKFFKMVSLNSNLTLHKLNQSKSDLSKLYDIEVFLNISTSRDIKLLLLQLRFSKQVKTTGYIKHELTIKFLITQKTPMNPGR
jgi:hypothetical protein